MAQTTLIVDISHLTYRSSLLGENLYTSINYPTKAVFWYFEFNQ